MPPLPELNDDVVGEILARIPPDESAHLARASLVCRAWRRVVLSGAGGFARRYRELHRTPPLLGFLHNTERGRLFFPTAATCPFPRPPEASDRWWDLDYRRLKALDCRHGRVLLGHVDTTRWTYHFIVWDPVTGDRHVLPDPGIRCLFSSAMVICAAAAMAGGCDHCGCAGGPFLVVYVCNIGGTVHGCVYSSEARAWGTLASLHLGTGCDNLDFKRGALVVAGDDAAAAAAYFVVCSGAMLVRYDFGGNKNRLSAIETPAAGYKTGIVIMPADDGSLGLAGIKGSKIRMYTRKKMNSRQQRWALCRVMELEKLLPVDAGSCKQASLIGFAEGVGVMFVKIGLSGPCFMVEVKSGQARKVCEFKEFFTVLPFMSFHTPGSAASSTLPLPGEE